MVKIMVPNPIKHGMIWGFSHIFGNIQKCWRRGDEHFPSLCRCFRLEEGRTSAKGDLWMKIRGMGDSRVGMMPMIYRDPLLKM